MPKVDYKEVLKPEDFEVFSRLRDWRKAEAEQEGVPVYGVFTNEQLAEMVRQRAGTKAALKGIAGVGEARVEKYGAAQGGLDTWHRPQHKATGRLGKRKKVKSG